MSRDETERILRRIRERPGARERIEAEVARMEVEQGRVPSYDELLAEVERLRRLLDHVRQDVEDMHDERAQLRAELAERTRECNVACRLSADDEDRLRHERAEAENLRADLGEARRLVTMLLEYGTEGMDFETLPEWARGKQW